MAGTPCTDTSFLTTRNWLPTPSLRPRPIPFHSVRKEGANNFMQKETSPYNCHVFVCTNDRHGERKSCADGGGNAELKDYLKDQVDKRGWKGRVRVSSGGCMGLCGKGPNVMIYPQKAWFAVASPADGDRILEEIEMLLSTDTKGR
jgi:(2Fe-2S) ferredoxin